jgi:hypothetical protein
MHAKKRKSGSLGHYSGPLGVSSARNEWNGRAISRREAPKRGARKMKARRIDFLGAHFP